jgi:hypothetical protein
MRETVDRAMALFTSMLPATYAIVSARPRVMVPRVENAIYGMWPWGQCTAKGRLVLPSRSPGIARFVDQPEDRLKNSGAEAAQPSLKRFINFTIGTSVRTNGEVVVLDSAGYGAFAITQAVSITAPPRHLRRYIGLFGRWDRHKCRGIGYGGLARPDGEQSRKHGQWRSLQHGPEAARGELRD